AWLAGWYGVRSIQLRDRNRGIAAVLMLAALPAMFFGSGLLSELGQRAAFVFLRPAYDRVVKDAAEGTLAWSTNYYGTERDGLEYAFKGGPSGLVIFRWVVGIPDGGTAIVFDATDQAATITKPGLQTTIATDLLGLLGEAPQRCSFFADP